MEFEKSLKSTIMRDFTEESTTTATTSFFNSTDVDKVRDDHDRNGLILGWAEFGAFLLGTPLNLLVIYLCLGIVRKNGCNNQWIVLSMTFADLIFMIVHCPLMFGRYALKSGYELPTCMFLYIATYLSTISSSLSLLLLNVDKFIYLHKPLHYFVIMTKTKVFAGIFVCWLVSIGWALFFLLGPMTKAKAPPCDFHPIMISTYIVFFVLFFIVPILLSLVISVYIAFIVRSTAKANELRRARLHSSSRTSTASVTTLGKAKARFHPHLRSIVFVFSTTIWSSLSSLPYRLLYSFILMERGNNKDPGYKINPTWVMVCYYLFILVTMNAVFNPAITIVTQRSYLEAVKALWNRILGNPPAKTRRLNSYCPSDHVITRHSIVTSVTSLDVSNTSSVNNNNKHSNKMSLISEDSTGSSNSSGSSLYRQKKRASSKRFLSFMNRPHPRIAAASDVTKTSDDL